MEEKLSEIENLTLKDKLASTLLFLVFFFWWCSTIVFGFIFGFSLGQLEITSDITARNNAIGFGVACFFMYSVSFILRIFFTRMKSIKRFPDDVSCLHMCIAGKILIWVSLFYWSIALVFTIVCGWCTGKYELQTRSEFIAGAIITGFIVVSMLICSFMCRWKFCF